MGLASGALEWWEEWQLRILVLSSVFVQFFLFFSLWVRRVPTLRRLRVVLWMAYIGGDALAIYALATLFNRHRQRTMDVMGESRSSSDLEVLWAPVLLIHLCGQVSMTAFSLEDNELWLCHVITLVSQVTVALYVFCKWWSGELRLLLVAVMLFVFGILKFSLKPWALRRSSYSQMMASIDVSLQRGEKCSISTFAWLTWCCTPNTTKKEGDGAIRDNTLSLDALSLDALSLDEYVQQAKMICTVKKAATSSGEHAELMSIRHIDYFVDLSAPYGGRLSDLQHLQNNNNKTTNASYEMLQECFEHTFNLLYTRVGVRFTRFESLLVIFLPFLALASVVLFATSHKHGYNNRDVKVTYILLSCTTLLEFLLPLCVVIWIIPCLKFLIDYMDFDSWHDLVSQCDLMSFYVCKKKPTFLMKIVFFKCLREYVSKVWYVRQVPAACEITEFVQRHIEEDGWKTFISDAATYRRFSDFRGQLNLKKHEQCDLGEELWDSLGVPLDESILLWHMATNLCFHRPVDKPSSFPRGQSHLTQRSMEMSGYMLYLLFIRTEMLLPGTRPGLFTVAIYELEDILKNSNAKVLVNEEALAQEIIEHTDGSTLIHEACRLAVSLMKMDEEEMWRIIQGVWVEMLCYSASRSRGLLHAKSLGEGGEYLSNVWLLWSYMGMETLADKIQKPASPAEKEILAAGELASSSQGRFSRQSSNGGISSPV